MIRVSLDSIVPGMKVGKPVFDNDGSMLLGRGVAMNPFFVKRLAAMGVESVYIQTDQTTDVVPHENINEMVRGSTIRHLKDVYKSLGDLSRQITADTRSALLDSITSPRFQKTFGSSPAFRALADDTRNIVDQLLNGDVTIGLTSIKSYDNYTFQHSVDVAVIAIMLGRKTGLPVKRLRELGMGCLLHDMGKILISDTIINKPDRLTDDEFEQVKLHPLIGYELIKGVPSIGMLPSHVALQHHERQDGTGYPRGLRGRNDTAITNEPRVMHLYASIAAVADVYDALSSDRPYRAAHQPERVMEIMHGMNGTHLNSEVFRSLVAIAPIYPEGSTVRLLNGPYTGHFGVSIGLNREDLARPVVRIIYDARKAPINPVELNLAEHGDLQIEAAAL